MTDTFAVLGQSAPLATTLTALYTVPAATQVAGSSLVVCNQSGTATSFRVSVAVAGAADTAKQYLHYDVPIAGNDSLSLEIGLTLGAADVVRVYAALATLSFNLFGVAVT